MCLTSHKLNVDADPEVQAEDIGGTFWNPKSGVDHAMEHSTKPEDSVCFDRQANL